MTSHDPDFWERAGDVCGLYLNPPDNAVVWSVDEKTGMQATSRINPTRPAIPGIPARREFEYRRHGTAVLFAALDVHDGAIAGWVTDSTRSENFVAFLADLVDQTPIGLDLHCVVDNLKTHSTELVDTFLEQHPHVHLHFTPTHAVVAEPGRAVLLDPAAPPPQTRRVQLGRRPRRPDHRLHQGLQPSRRPIPLDLRRPPTQSRVDHNDLRVVVLASRRPSDRMRRSAMPSDVTSSPGADFPGQEDHSGTVGRRAALKKAAIAAGVVAWTTPVVQAVTARPVHAATTGCAPMFSAVAF